jgi:Bifunctional DNA primase/polymerase, N-terminal
MTLAHDKAMAANFFANFDPNASEVTIHFFSDSHEHKYPEVIHGTTDDVWSKIPWRNSRERRVGVFVDQTEHPRALFARAQGKEQIKHSVAVIKACGAQPSMLVETSADALEYYFICHGIPRDQFSHLQQSLSDKLGTDPVDRVRLPGTFCFKDPTTPQFVKLLTNGAVKIWEFDDLTRKFGLPVKENKSPPGDDHSPLAIARGYLKRDWNPIPVSRQTKKPIGKNWQHRRLDSKTVAKAFNRADMNIGVQLGPMSGGLTDVDLDCLEAVTIGPMLLPQSNNVFGRAGKPRSHWLYRTTVAEKVAKAWLQFRDVNDAMLLELKIGGGGKGSQSVFPGSVHESGEAINWDRDGELKSVDDDELLRQVRRLAAAVLLARHWPAEGGRHEAALTVGGVLARAGFDEDAAMLMLGAIAEVVGGGRHTAEAGRDAVKQYKNGGDTRGFPKLKETFGEKVVRHHQPAG